MNNAAYFSLFLHLISKQILYSHHSLCTSKSLMTCLIRFNYIAHKMCCHLNNSTSLLKYATQCCLEGMVLQQPSAQQTAAATLTHSLLKLWDRHSEIAELQTLCLAISCTFFVLFCGVLAIFLTTICQMTSDSHLTFQRSSWRYVLKAEGGWC